MKKPIKYLKYSFFTILLLIGLLLILLFFSDWIVVHYPERYNVRIFTKKPLKDSLPETPPDSLKIMTYNIKFGGGRINFFWDCYGDRIIMTKKEVIENLTNLTRKINHYDPDILLLQEVDRFSKRSAYIDQARWILESTPLKYGAFASQWHVFYVPVKGMGKMNSGNLILSKYPIVSAVRIKLPLIESQDILTQQFYLRRNILHAKILVSPTDTLDVITTHLSAYTQDSTRIKQLKILYTLLDSLDKAGKTFVLGGDLNTLPPGTKKFKDFDDSACKGKDESFVMDDYERELNWLKPFYDRFYEAIPLDKYTENEKKYYSSSVNPNGFWNKRLDYIFSNKKLCNGKVHQENTYNLSDHAPVTATLLLQDSLNCKTEIP